MSDYDDLEESVAASAPVEGYKFSGTFRDYLYTSANRKIEIATGPGGALERYYPVAVTRSRIKAGTQEDENLSLDLEIPFDTDVVLDYAYAQTPPKLRLEVYRQQSDNPAAFTLFWQGVVRGFNVAGRLAKVQVPSIFSLALQGEIPNVYYQAPCNHILYDERCSVSRATNMAARVVGGVSGVTINLTSSPGTDADFAAGEIVNMRTGERRLILSNVGAVVTIGYAFVDIRPGDNVQLFRGCDHSLATCKAKFNNVINFGGHPYIPADNPFEGSL
ncbi:hypothetical protein [Sphingomonas phage Kimi]|nr:hypothetical protein [Sphingomonas phage Kimi]